jgi:hypothetical protein
MESLEELISAHLLRTLEAPEGSFTIFDVGRADHYVQWSIGAGELVVEIANTQNNMGEPMSESQLKTIASLGFGEEGPNFARWFPARDIAVRDVATIVFSALRTVFGLHDAAALRVYENLTGA